MARILIVDDQPAILKLVEAILNKAGHSCTSAKDGLDGVERAKSMPFDLIISDAVMPGGVSGFDLVKTLRADARNAEVPIILLTGKSEKRDVARAIQAGVNDYMVKPVQPDLLTAKVASLLSRKASGTLTPTSGAGAVAKPAAVNEVMLNDVGSIQVPLLLTRLTEGNVTLKTPIALIVGAKFPLSVALFNKIGITAPFVRVVSCTPDPAGEGAVTFTVRAQIADLSAPDREKIALWMNTQAPVRQAG